MNLRNDCFLISRINKWEFSSVENEITCSKLGASWFNYLDREVEIGINRRYSEVDHISILNHIDLEVFIEILNDLYSIYKSSHPYSEISNFIENYLSHTVFELEKFVKLNQYIEGSFFEGYVIFESYDLKNREYRYYAIEESLDIEYFDQYFKNVIDFINNTFKLTTDINVAFKSNDFPLIFHSHETYSLFLYLEENYELDLTPSKYSHIYHFLVGIIGKHSLSKKKYLEFLKGIGIDISKIQEQNNKYDDKILPQLRALKEGFNKINQNE